MFKKIVLIVLILGFVTACSKEEPQQPDEPLFPQEDEAPLLPDIPETEQPIVVPEPPKKPAQLTLSNKSVKFAPVKTGERTNFSLTIQNTGEEVLAIQQLEMVNQSDGQIKITGGNCQAGRSLQANEVCDIKLQFAPTSPSAETVSDQILLITNLTGQDKVRRIALSGENSTPPPAQPDPVPVPIVAAPPPAPVEPPVEYLNMLEVMQQRRSGKTSVNLTEADRMRQIFVKDEDLNYRDQGVAGTISSLPVDRSLIITADKIIPAVLETTINSELGSANVFAIVERHVFGSDGRYILIPAGSRIIGRSESVSNRIAERMEVRWNRIIRPDGVSILIRNAVATDAMGRAGMIGDVDNRYWERYGIPILVSAIQRGTELLVADDADESIGVVTDENGNVTDSFPILTGQSRVLADFIEDISGSLENFVSSYEDTVPLITIPGGTRFNVVLTEDIYFKNNEFVSLKNIEKGLGYAEGTLTGVIPKLEGEIDPNENTPNNQTNNVNAPPRANFVVIDGAPILPPSNVN